MSEAKKIIYNEHRPLKARATTKKIVETTKVVTTSYQCLISSKIRGVCRAQIIQNTPHGDELSHAKATTYMVKVSRIDTCECHNLLTTNRGLHPTIKELVDKAMGNTTHLSPKQMHLEIMKMLESVDVNRVSTAEDRECIKQQIANRIDYHKKIFQQIGSTTGNVTVVADLIAINEDYQFHPPPTPRKGLKTEVMVQEYGKELFDENLLQVIQPTDGTSPRENAFRFMTILKPYDALDKKISTEETNLKCRIDFLTTKGPKKQQYEKEGNVFHTTTVFSSLVLLWNIVQCEDLEWKVAGAADGTDGMTCNNYQLLSFGAIHVNKRGVKQFQPLFYVLGAGEREEVFNVGLLAFLRYCRLLFGITSIQFEGGLSSDHSTVFTSGFYLAFTTSLRLQCFTHILRKFSLNTKGNGDYARLTNSKTFLSTIAIHDVRNLYRCQSFEMFQQYATLLKEAWLANGEEKITSTFFKSYVDNNVFNKWHVNCSKLPGCLPTNNPQERVNLECKGTNKIEGLSSVGKNMHTMLLKEFPIMIHNLSLTRAGVRQSLLIDQEKIVLHRKSEIYKNLVLYFQNFEASLDKRTVRQSEHVLIIYVNIFEFLSEPVTKKRCDDYELSLKGTTLYTYEERQKYMDSVGSMCKITCTTSSTVGTTTYEGSCFEYYNKTYCQHTAYFKYNTTLLSTARSIPNSRKSSNTNYKYSASANSNHSRNQSTRHLIKHNAEMLVPSLPKFNLFC